MSAPMLRRWVVFLKYYGNIGHQCQNSLRQIERGYAKKLAVPIGGKKSKAAIEVETDPEKLTTHCCGLNYFKEGEDPELKPDSEYPDWLWTLRTEREPAPLEELDPMTWEYWRRVRKMNIVRDNQLAKMRFRKP